MPDAARRARHLFRDYLGRATRSIGDMAAPVYSAIADPHDGLRQALCRGLVDAREPSGRAAGDVPFGPLVLDLFRHGDGAEMKNLCTDAIHHRYSGGGDSRERSFRFIDANAMHGGIESGPWRASHKWQPALALWTGWPIAKCAAKRANLLTALMGRDHANVGEGGEGDV